MLNQAEWFHICLDICYKKSLALNTTGLLLYHYRATSGRQLADFCFSDFGFLWNKGITIKMAGDRKKRKKMWVVPQIKRWGTFVWEGESLPLLCAARASWLQGPDQLKILFMPVGQKGETVAMFSSYMKGPECSNEM